MPVLIGPLKHVVKILRPPRGAIGVAAVTAAVVRAAEKRAVVAEWSRGRQFLGPARILKN